jgi:hypothetical protein
MIALRPLRQWEPSPSALFTPEWTDQDQGEVALRNAITVAVNEIAGPRPAAGAIKKKVAKLAADLARVRNTARDLPDGALRSLGAEELIANLEQVREQAARWSDKIPVKRTSGSTVDGERMLLAAASARHLLITFTEKPVTLTRGGDYFKISALLYRIATGKRANLEKPCARHLHQIQRSLVASGKPNQPDWLDLPKK